MPNKQRKTEDILKASQETLDVAEIGYETFVRSSPKIKLVGLRNLVVFGRAVTNVLQNLKSTEPEFEEWYKKYQDEMRADPLMKYFYDLRSEILKEGKLQVGVRAYIDHLSLPTDMRRFGLPPPNVKSFFIGDNLGGTGWIVQLANGSTEKYYVDLPTDIGSVDIVFPNPPEHHDGKKITDNSVQNLARIYLDYLQQLIKIAKEKFTTQI